MQLVEQHVIKPTDPRYRVIDKASPNVFRNNGVEDGKGMLASLAVHPVRIVVPVRTQKASGQ